MEKNERVRSRQSSRARGRGSAFEQIELAMSSLARPWFIGNFDIGADTDVFYNFTSKTGIAGIAGVFTVATAGES